MKKEIKIKVNTDSFREFDLLKGGRVTIAKGCVAMVAEVYKEVCSVTLKMGKVILLNEMYEDVQLWLTGGAE